MHGDLILSLFLLFFINKQIRQRYDKKMKVLNKDRLALGNYSTTEYVQTV